MDMKIIGALAKDISRRRKFDYCGIASALVYRPHISPEPIPIKDQHELSQYGGLQPFDRLMVHEVPLDGDVAEEPTDVLFGNLKIYDLGEEEGDK
jgi:hypothetical protein